jgi:hypothetical protein
LFCHVLSGVEQQPIIRQQLVISEEEAAAVQSVVETTAGYTRERLTAVQSAEEKIAWFYLV